MSDDPISAAPTAVKPLKVEKDIADEYIQQARERYSASSDDIEIDDEPKVSISQRGAWVSAWVWVGKAEES